LILAALIGGLFFVQPAEVATCPVDRPDFDGVVEQVAKQVSDAVWHDMTGTEEGRALIRSYNAMPPLEITVSLDNVVGYFTASSRAEEIYLVIFEDGCQAVGATVYDFTMRRIIEDFRQKSGLPLILAQNQSAPCAGRKDILGRLAAQFKETPRSMGLSRSGTVIEVLASPDGITWTIVQTYPNGTSCMMAAGHNWEDSPIPGTAGQPL
jgi:hypothetical protein